MVNAPTESPDSQTSTSPAHMEVEDLHRAFQVGKKTIEVLKGVSFSVQEGEMLFLCGASGAGKTSLLYTMAGLEQPTGGRILFQGDSLYDQAPHEQAAIRNQEMGYVFQNYFLLPELTAMENVLLPSMIGGSPAKARARELLGRVGLSHRGNHLPAELSGGEQQRVAIARSLINDPGMLFADEPTGNLDSKTGQEVMQVLLDVVRSEKRTLVVVTHDTSLAQTGDRMLTLVDGKLVF